MERLLNPKPSRSSATVANVIRSPLISCLYRRRWRFEAQAAHNNINRTSRGDTETGLITLILREESGEIRGDGGNSSQWLQQWSNWLIEQDRD
jgi:hypothetical protein